MDMLDGESTQNGETETKDLVAPPGDGDCNGECNIEETTEVSKKKKKKKKKAKKGE